MYVCVFSFTNKLLAYYVHIVYISIHINTYINKKIITAA